MTAVSGEANGFLLPITLPRVYCCLVVRNLVIQKFYIPSIIHASVSFVQQMTTLCWPEDKNQCPRKVGIVID
ncbi:hypothetical protein DDO10_13390 [Vibrio cholerae]|nr:hypothetical protein [Vibrio cholerae]EGR4401858.1 hypothetical protein [Vibrio cholerae]PAS11439.1 hypothetical protein CGT78_16435 [Vibrio cholerae]